MLLKSFLAGYIDMPTQPRATDSSVGGVRALTQRSEMQEEIAATVSYRTDILKTTEQE